MNLGFRKAVVLVVTLAMVACFATVNVMAASKTIGISLPTKELARCLKDQEYLTNYLTEMGYKVEVQFGLGDPNVQVAQIENMITRGVDGLIISPMDAWSMTGIAELAHENGIPVIAYDMLIMETQYIDYYCTDDLVKVGEVQGQYIVDALGLAEGRGPFNLEIVAGDPADNNAPYFYNGAMNVLRPYIENGQLVVPSGQIDFSVTATPGWDGAKAQARMDALLSAHYTDKQLHAVLCSNDSVALGTVSALKSVGYGSPDLPFPIITGQDADMASIKSIITGEQTMTVFKDIQILAQYGASLIDCLVRGETPNMEGGTTFHNGVKDVQTLVVAPKPVDINNWEEVLFQSGYYSWDEL